MEKAQNTAIPTPSGDPRLDRLISLWTVSEDTKEQLLACHTYEEYEDVVMKHALSYSSHTTDTFHKFYGMKRYIPAGVLIRLAFDAIYSTYRIDRGMFFELVADALVMESPAEKAEREEIVRNHLKEYIQPNGKVTLYRGATSRSMKPFSAISYTVNRERAEWFKNRGQLFGGTEGTVIEKDFPLSSILWYTNCRNEQEAIVISPCLKRYINEALAKRERERRRQPAALVR